MMPDWRIAFLIVVCSRTIQRCQGRLERLVAGSDRLEFAATFGVLACLFPGYISGLRSRFPPGFYSESGGKARSEAAIPSTPRARARYQLQVATRSHCLDAGGARD